MDSHIASTSSSARALTTADVPTTASRSSVTQKKLFTANRAFIATAPADFIERSRREWRIANDVFSKNRGFIYEMLAQKAERELDLRAPASFASVPPPPSYEELTPARFRDNIRYLQWAISGVNYRLFQPTVVRIVEENLLRGLGRNITHFSIGKARLVRSLVRLVHVDMLHFPEPVTIRQPSGNLVHHFYMTHGIQRPTMRVLLAYRDFHPNERISIVIRIPLDGHEEIITKPLDDFISGRNDAVVWNGSGEETDCEILEWYAVEPPYTGSCDTHVSRITNMGPFEILTLRSENNNCIVACFCYHAKSNAKHKTLVKRLGLSTGPKSNEDIAKLCTHFKLHCRVWALSSTEPTTPIGVFGSTDCPIIDVLLSHGHYYYILQGAPAAGAIDYIAKKKKKRGAEQQISRANARNLMETIPDPGTNDFTGLVNLISSESTTNWFIDGPSGVGKTELAKLIIARLPCDSVIVTAATGIAASLIRGQTLHHFYLTHSRNESQSSLTGKTLLIDEIGMVDGLFMSQVVQFVLRSGLRLILVGDIHQLPPVRETSCGFFFQADSFQALHLHRIALTRVRRTDNAEYAALCGRIRTGHPTAADLSYLSSKYVDNADPMDYELYIASTNRKVDAHNEQAHARLTTPAVSFPIRWAFNYDGNHPELPPPRSEKLMTRLRECPDILAKKAEKRSVSLKVGARVICTQNTHTFKNGELGNIIAMDSEKASITVRLDNDAREVAVHYVSNEINTKCKYVISRPRDLKYSYIPLRLAYALTIHKSQGSTIRKRVLFDSSGIFARGMYYTAITRVSDPDLLTITGGHQTPRVVDYEPHNIVAKFEKGLRVQSLSEMIQSQSSDGDNADDNSWSEGIAGRPIDCKKRNPDEPLEVLFYDYETATKERRLCPYLLTAVRVERYKPEPMSERSFVISDIPGLPDSTYAENVTDALIAEIVALIARFESHLSSLPNARADPHTKGARDLQTYANKHCPRICAYNGARFDQFLLTERLINTSLLDPARYRPKFVFKGSTMVCFSVTNLETRCTVLKSHDLYQITTMSLKDACSSFLPGEPGKIDFKHEIMDISRKRYAEWSDWSWDDWSSRKQSIVVEEIPPAFGTSLRRFATERNLEYMPADVISYGIRDTDCLARLYKSVDCLVRDLSGLSVFSFLTMASMTWYCGIQGAVGEIGITPVPVPTSEGSDKEIKTRTKRRNKFLPLYTLNYEQDKFVRKSIYGGRACPRIFHSDPSREYVYVDISAMYGSIMSRAKLPCGVISNVDPEKSDYYLEIIRKYALEMTTAHGIQSVTFENLPVFWIARCEFKERADSLEPVVPSKSDSTSASATSYSVRLRKAVITSLDAALILIKGGTIAKVGKMIHFARGDKWASPWVTRCIEGKDKYKGQPLSLMYKMAGNSFYGSTGRRDHENEYQIVRREEETMDFLVRFDWKWALVSWGGSFDVMYGKRKGLEDVYTSSRPAYASAFILAYSRLMVQQMVAIINPTEDPREQPLWGDTDSLVVTREAALRLRESGWFPPSGAIPGQLTDELLDILIKQTRSDSHKRALLCAQRDGAFAIITRGYSPAPKVLACEFRDPVDGTTYYKFRCKGISQSSHICARDRELISAGLLFDHAISPGMTASFVLPDGIKRYAPGSVPVRDREKSRLLLTLESFVSLTRTIFTKPWRGRELLTPGGEQGITVPFGYAKALDANAPRDTDLGATSDSQPTSPLSHLQPIPVLSDAEFGEFE